MFSIFLPENSLEWEKIYFRSCRNILKYWNLGCKNLINNKYILISYNKTQEKFILYCDIIDNYLILEKTLVTIEKIDKNQIWLTGSITNSYNLSIKNNTFNYLDNIVTITNKNELVFNYDIKSEINNNHFSKYYIYKIYDKYDFKYIHEKIKLNIPDYFLLVDILNFYYKLVFNDIPKNSEKIIYYDSTLNNNIKKTIEININTLELFINKYETNKNILEYLYEKISKYKKKNTIIDIEKIKINIDNLFLKYYLLRHVSINYVNVDDEINNNEWEII